MLWPCMVNGNGTPPWSTAQPDELLTDSDGNNQPNKGIEQHGSSLSSGTATWNSVGLKATPQQSTKRAARRRSAMVKGTGKGNGGNQSNMELHWLGIKSTNSNNQPNERAREWHGVGVAWSRSAMVKENGSLPWSVIPKDP
jgi:hypothetical protein